MRKDVDEMSAIAGGLFSLCARRLRRDRAAHRHDDGAGGVAQRRRAQRPCHDSHVSRPACRDREAGSFKRCLANLVSNAARHAKTISITGHRDHRYLTVTNHDERAGIPVKMREEVFKPFLRSTLRPATRTKAALAWLAIARDIARSHGGDITLGDARWAACGRR